MAQDRILVINVSGIGDFVDSTPALRMLRKAKQNARITLLVSEKAFPLAHDCPYVDEVISMPTAPGRSMPTWRDFPRWFLAMWRLRARFATVIHLYEISTWAGECLVRWLVFWSGRGVSVGRLAGGRGRFFSRAVPDRPGQDNVQAYLEVISLAVSLPVSPKADEKKLELWIPPAAITEVDHWLRMLSMWGKLNGPLVLVALGGDRRTRHELPERAEEWLSSLQVEFKIRPVLFGRKSDPGLTSGTHIIHADARGLWEITQSAALVSLVDAVITTHSVPQHLASVWDIPVIVLVGPGDAQKYRPHVSKGRMQLLSHSVPCAPCYYQECPWSGVEHQKCLTGIPPEAVVRAFREIAPTQRLLQGQAS